MLLENLEMLTVCLVSAGSKFHRLGGRVVKGMNVAVNF